MFSVIFRLFGLAAVASALLLGFGLIMSFATGRLKMPISDADMQPIGLVIFGSVAVFFVLRRIVRSIRA